MVNQRSLMRRLTNQFLDTYSLPNFLAVAYVSLGKINKLRISL